MRVAFVLPGLHRVVRGAEVAFESVARELAKLDGVEVTLFGSGSERPGEPYQFRHVDNAVRENFEHWPKLPLFRNEYVYEEITFLNHLRRDYRPEEFDITVTCSYPFMNWFLRWSGGKQRPAHIFVTQNGDHMAVSNQSEFRFFACDGLICTNPDYLDRNQQRWFSALVPNGVDPTIFSPGASERDLFDLPANRPVALMVSALITSKRVTEGIRAAAEVDNLHLVVCGDGPERDRVVALGNELMPGRFHWKKLPRHQMPKIYRSADLFLHMSLDEPSANAYIEALATGLPIVTHERRVTQWTLEDVAVLVDATDRTQVVNGIQTALQRKTEQDIAARRDLVSRRFTWQQIGLQYQAFFAEVLQRRQA
jgi:glycosyltransferase involved in cell wall biosynthesis